MNKRNNSVVMLTPGPATRQQSRVDTTMVREIEDILKSIVDIDTEKVNKINKLFDRLYTIYTSFSSVRTIDNYPVTPAQEKSFLDNYYNFIYDYVEQTLPDDRKKVLLCDKHNDHIVYQGECLDTQYRIGQVQKNLRLQVTRRVHNIIEAWRLYLDHRVNIENNIVHTATKLNKVLNKLDGTKFRCKKR